MNDENLQPQAAESAAAGAESDTADVRAAIERTKENLQAQGEELTGNPANEETLFSERTGSSSGELRIQDPGAQMPSAAPVANATVQQPSVLPEQPTVVAPVATGVQAGEAATFTVPSDHPMAHLYIQKPMPPTLKSNRLMGVLIALIATIGFGALYAGVLALILAPFYTASSFMEKAMLPYLTSYGFILPVIAFFLGAMILVLIFNRAGWWVYAVLGVFVALLVWVVAGVGYTLSPQLFPDTGESYSFSLRRMMSFMATLPAIIAAFAAREVITWFGAWIGARGKRIKQKNAEEMQEYEKQLAEIQAKIQ